MNPMIDKLHGYVAEIVAAFPEVRLVQESGAVKVGVPTTSDDWFRLPAEDLT